MRGVCGPSPGARAGAVIGLPVLGILFVLATATACSPVEPAASIAVASNFRSAFEEIAERFEADTGHHVEASFGSTGKQYAQIVNGAPFAAFLAADAARPRRLEESGYAVPGSRITYAVGRLVLWSPSRWLVDAEGDVLAGGDFRHLAIANPALAPYGEAARQVLEARGLWNRLEPRLVTGENVAQAFQYVVTANADLGFVARSQVSTGRLSVSGSRWEVPPALHAPIEQQAVLLGDDEAARALLAWISSPDGRDVVRAHGYDTP